MRQLIFFGSYLLCYFISIQTLSSQPTLISGNVNNTGSSSPTNLIEVNGNLYFTAFNGNYTDIWKYDDQNIPINLTNNTGSVTYSHLTELNGSF